MLSGMLAAWSARQCDVLLVAADREKRSLLLAELQEAGFDVVSMPGLRYALRALFPQRVRPRLILLDEDGDPDATPGYVEQIPRLVPGVPLLVIAGAFGMAAWQPMQDRDVEILRRPLTVGNVVEAVRRRLGGECGEG
jgi:DNA-binding NtrC family response regulator